MKLTLLLTALSFNLFDAYASVPLVMYSHKLVPKIQQYIREYNHLEMPSERVEEVARKMINDCSSNAIILVNQPGLTLDDLADYEPFTVLRTYCFMSSTLGVVPRMDKPLNLDQLATHSLDKCGGELVQVDGYDEVDTYIDSGKRVIRINFPELSEDPEERRVALLKSDFAIRKTIRKLPSPDHMMVYTTSTRGLRDADEEPRRWSRMQIFPDVSNDASRSVEFERNNNVVESQRELPARRTGLLNRAIFQGSTLLDKDVIFENELLVLGIAGVGGVFALFQVWSLLRFILQRTQTTTTVETQQQGRRKTD